MPLPRFFFPDKLSPGTVVSLPDKAAHHASRVLRLGSGDDITLFNGDGHDYAASLLRVTKDGASAKVTGCRMTECESPLRITLAQAISSGDRMDFTLQKAVELGVSDIQPIAAERSVVRLAGERAEKRLAHWRNVIVSACEQCGRAIVPQIYVPVTLSDWLGTLPEHDLKILLSPTATRTLHDLPHPQGDICLLAGCEGGFTTTETQNAERHGFLPIRLGSRILRTESAALAALAAMQTLWGDF